MKFLSNSTQTLLSTLAEKVLDSKFAKLNQVGFLQKSIGGRDYWYCQYADTSGARRQRYVGLDDEAIRGLIERTKAHQESCVSILQERKRLVAMALAGGAQAARGRPAKILEKLSDVGVFDSGGTLIGSYAFACYGSLLGVELDEALRKTDDMDIAADRSIGIGITAGSSINLRHDVGSVDSEMKEPRQINPWVPPYELVAPDGFKLEFLTSFENTVYLDQQGQSADRAIVSPRSPVSILQFSVNALPLRHLDFIMENTVDALVLYGAAIPVKVPDPARFAMHKLAVSQLRPSTKPEKKRKDLLQASALIEYLIEESPGSLLLATDAAKASGAEFERLIESGVQDMADAPLAERFTKQFWRETFPSPKG